MFKSLSKKLAIDLGSSIIRIVSVDDLKSEVWELSPLDFRAKVIEEAACLARRKDNHKLLAIGNEALGMQGRLDSLAEIVFPFANSRILDQEAALVLLRELLKKAFGGLVFSPELMLTTSAAITPLSRKLLSQLFYDLGFTKVHLIASPLAAAIGAGVPVADTSGTLFLQMGAGSLQLGIVALGSLLFYEESKFAGNRLDLEIIEHLTWQENFVISLSGAKQLKKEVFSLVPSKKSLTLLGKSNTLANPLELKIKTDNLQAVVDKFKLELEVLSKALLDKIPPDLLKDALQKGLLLSGALARIQGLEDFLSAKLNLPVALLDEPDMLASMGAATMLKNIGSFGHGLSFEI